MGFVFNQAVKAAKPAEMPKQAATAIAQAPAAAQQLPTPTAAPIAKSSPFAALAKSTAAVKKPAVATASATTLGNPFTAPVKATPAKDTMLPTDAVTVIENEAVVGTGAEGEDDVDIIPMIDAEEFNNPGQPDKMNATAVNELKVNMQLLIDSMDQPDKVGRQLYSIMQHVQEHPFLVEHLAPADVGLMVMGLRTTYGVVVQKKVQKREKRDNKQLTIAEINNELAGFGQLAM